jgi:hypothetical protein
MTTDNLQPHRPQPRKTRLSIRARLVILALLAVGPLMFDRVRLLENSRAERIELASAELLDFAEDAVQAQREMTANIRAVLQILAHDYAVASASADGCNRSLFNLANNIPWIRWISIIGADGRVACSVDQTAIGLDVSDRTYVHEALRTKSFVVSDYVVAKVFGRQRRHNCRRRQGHSELDRQNHRQHAAAEGHCGRQNRNHHHRGV